MSKEQKQSYYYYPDTAYIDIDYTEYNKDKNKPEKFLKKFNEIDLSRCSKELKQYYLKKLKQFRKFYRKLSKAREKGIDYAYENYITLSQFSVKLDRIVDTDIENINEKKRGIKRFSNYYNRYMEFLEKVRDYDDKWDEVLTKAIRKLGGE